MKKWMVLITLSMSMFIIVVDTTIMNVSISALIEDLDTSVGGIQAGMSFLVFIALPGLVMTIRLPKRKLVETQGASE